MKEYARGMMWGEGPRWNAGALWLSDTQGSRLWTDASGTWTPTDVDAVSNGLWFLPDGRLAAALMHEARLATWSGKSWDTLCDLSPLGAGPLGDLVGDSYGNLYVDDVAFNAAAAEPSAPGRIILVRPDGSAEVAAEEVEFPNGLAFLDNGQTLVVAETARQRLIAFEVAVDGRLGDRRVWADVAAGVGPAARPDGIWPAVEGGVWVATTTGQSLVRMVEGSLEEVIDLAPEFPIACCLNDAGHVLVTLADSAGAPLMEALARRAVSARVAVVERRPNRRRLVSHRRDRRLGRGTQ